MLHCLDCDHEWEPRGDPKRPRCSKCGSQRIETIKEPTPDPERSVQDQQIQELQQQLAEKDQELVETIQEAVLALKEASELKQGSAVYVKGKTVRYCIDCETGKVPPGAESDRCNPCQQRHIREEKKRNRRYCEGIGCGVDITHRPPNHKLCPKCYSQKKRDEERNWILMNPDAIRKHTYQNPTYRESQRFELI